VDELLAAEHLVALAVIAVVITILVLATRRWPGAWTRYVSMALAVVLVSAELGWWLYLASIGASGDQLASALPLQLCDAAIFISAAALVLRTPTLVELTYFWGLAGTIQALFTPDLPQHFPSFPYFQYYIAHGGIVAAALFLVVGLGLWPRREALVRVIIITVAYVAFVGLVDATTNSDYMFLRAKPASASVLDLLGPWPWYLVGGSVVALVLLFILDLPFRLLRRSSRALTR
jgi:hypothetical integral membrane protein (TIGR02206 family)